MLARDNTKLHVLHVISSLDPKTGGPAEFLRQIAIAQAGNGVVTEAVCGDFPESSWLATYPFLVHALGHSHILRRLRYSPAFSSWLCAHANDYDVAVVHGLWNWESLVARGGLRDRVPYVALIHGMMDPWFNRAYPIKSKAKQIVWRCGQGRLLRDAHAVLFTSEEERRLARQGFNGIRYRERVVAFGTADPPRSSAKQCTAFRTKVPSLRGRKYLLFLGRIHIKKGCDLVIRAFADQIPRDADLDLVLAGPAEATTRRELQTLAASLGISNRIHWPGMLDGDAKWGAFHGAEAFLLPSHSENFGIAVAEAAAASLPLLISDKVNIHAEVTAAGAGLVSTDDEAGTEAVLTRFLAMSSVDRRAMGARARILFLQKFEIRRVAYDLATVFNEASRGTSAIIG